MYLDEVIILFIMPGSSTGIAGCNLVYALYTTLSHYSTFMASASIKQYILITAGLYLYFFCRSLVTPVATRLALLSCKQQKDKGGRK
jgi:hypothetical protein